MAGSTYRTGTWRLRARPACRFDTERTFAFSLSVLRTPVKVGIRCRFFVVWPRSRPASGRWTGVGVKVERPQRSEDERPRGRRGSAAYSVGQDETKEVVVQVICGPPVRQHGR